uniref:Uncharacterized protein n=1 Tax=Arcella intermedia TaxID=1963864 RepID=A0A6B2LVT7_9EUKA
MVPDTLHGIPVDYEAVLNGGFDGKLGGEGRGLGFVFCDGFLANYFNGTVRIPTQHSGATVSGVVVSRKTSFSGTTAII